MKKQIIFFETQSGARTNIMANFQILDKAAFIHKVYHSGVKSSYWSMFRYGYVGGFADNLKGMTLEEFESEFTSADSCEFSKEQVDRLFRKEICMKWGTAGERAAIKPLKKSELKIGHTYIDFSGVSYLFMGRAKRVIVRPGRDIITEEGFGFLHNTSWNIESLDSTACGLDIIKSIKRLEKASDQPFVVLKPIYSGIVQGYFSSVGKYTIELLDVPEDEN